MFIGIYTLNDITHNNIYFVNKQKQEQVKRGYLLWEKDLLNANTKNIKTLLFSISGKTYQERKAEAVEIAKDWQNNFSCYDWSYSELATIYEFFEKVGKRYGLIKEFKENAII